MFCLFRSSSGKPFYINTLLSLLLFPYIDQCLQFLQFCGGDVMCILCIITLTVIYMHAENIKLKLILILN
jgi:hypothetical protein